MWAFFFVCSCHRFNALSGLGLGTDLQRTHNGITTEDPFPFPCVGESFWAMEVSLCREI